MDELDVDMELLIALVEANPIIWDKNLEDYKSRERTTTAWRNVCAGLIEDFEDLDDREKTEFGKEVLKKWRNVKDRWHKTQKQLMEQNLSGSRAKKAKKRYLYDKQLQFLRKNVNYGELEESLTVKSAENSKLDTAEPKNVKIEKVDIAKPAEKVEIAKPRNSKVIKESYSKPILKRKFVDDEVEERIVVKTVQKTEENRHLSFFKGILPTLEQFEEDEIPDFQLGVLNLLQSIRKSRPLACKHCAHIVGIRPNSPHSDKSDN